MLSASLVFGSLLAGGVSGSVLPKRAFTPTVKKATLLGNLADPAINRDSCGSVRVGDRAFWTCRDSQPYDSTGHPEFPIWSSSASWSNFEADVTPDLLMYGGENSRTPFFPYQPDECNGNTAGGCPDGSRYALWPDSPPLVASTVNNVVTIFSTDDPDPPTTLYKMTYDLNNPDRNALPTTTVVNEHFWARNSFPYGTYGNVAKDGVAYLFAAPSNGHIALAKVPLDSIEDTSAYQFWVNGAWTSTMPDLNNAGANIPNASAGGQGTYYFSEIWNKWVWIGQAGISVSADFFITTADSITGPWEPSVHFYSGQTGTYYLGAYSLQAHPGFNDAGVRTNNIYLTHTKNDQLGDSAVYSTPLIYIEWN
ncbi:hypothetical protein F5Y17DRAFT_466209 [Xylariaceae sp. FL0594]|nr:hypothetical protein F5Y17DRAFT_466209 [Xylariaceae sp. FL0594]